MNTNKSGCVVNSTLPFSTIRLKPIKQKTKHGIVEILDDGNLRLDFTGEKYIIDITADGNFVY